MLRFRRLASTSSLNFNFVPKHEPPTTSDIQALQSFVSEHSRILVITGAGVSTESGIPDYRSEGVGLYARSDRRPIKIQEFLSSAKSRKQYWARNFFGWSRFASLKPNLAHQTIRNWELNGKLSCLVTQNVDGLHKKAESFDTIELHGTGHLVVCVQCSYNIDRGIFHNILLDLNSHIHGRRRGGDDIRPDGDVELDPEVAEKFIIPPCPSCGGDLKPDIVFFGDNVPKQRVQRIYDHLNESDSLLVLGSSLQTFSAFRYIVSAKELGIPIGIVNLGPTRADGIANFKLLSRIGEILPCIRVS